MQLFLATVVMQTLFLAVCQAEIDKCALPMQVGPCKAHIPMFYFNKASGSCLPFVYGGCFGNANQFTTLNQCKQNCANDMQQNKCTLPKEIGPCKAKIPKFYFNQSTKTCDLFMYGGCLGNANQFDNAAECQNECLSDIGAMQRKDMAMTCMLAKEIGPCKARIPMYYYDA